MNNISSICVFCGAHDNLADKYIKLSEKCGEMIASKGIRLIYGGGDSGLMGVICHSAHRHGAMVTGVYPKFLHDREPISKDLDEIYIVDTMYERKKIMVSKADAFLILPGGIGTLDEVFEVITLKNLGVIDKPIIFINLDGYWDGFDALMKNIVDNNFASKSVYDNYYMVTSLAEAFEKLGI